MKAAPPLRMLAVTTAAALALVGCGTTGADDAGSAATTPATTDAVTASPSPSAASPTPDVLAVTDSTGTELVLDEPAHAIVSLSPSATESLFAIGAGDQVVAVDQFSYYPSEAPVTDLDALNPNVEAITTYEPDLVVASDDGLSSQLGEVGIPLLVQAAPATFDDVYAQVEQLGTVTGRVDAATDLVQDMQGEIDDLVAEAPDATGQTYFHELDSTLYSVTGDTFIGQVYGRFGLDNIADAVEDDAGGYPQLSPEFVVEANPDWIFLADAAFGESPETVAARPGWTTIDAVEQGRVVPLPEDVTSRWGPRVVDFVEVIATALADQGAAGTTTDPTEGDDG